MCDREKLIFFVNRRKKAIFESSDETFLTKANLFFLFPSTVSLIMILLFANKCDACWEMGENGQCVPAAGKISTLCGSNSITMTIDACVIDTPYVSNRKDRIYRI